MLVLTGWLLTVISWARRAFHLVERRVLVEPLRPVEEGLAAALSGEPNISNEALNSPEMLGQIGQRHQSLQRHLNLLGQGLAVKGTLRIEPDDPAFPDRPAVLARAHLRLTGNARHID